MNDTSHLPIEDMAFFKTLEETSDQLFEMVAKWSQFNQETVGKQLVRSYDSVGANLVEGDGRHTQPDSIRFFVTSRASGREARYWIRRAAARNLIAPEIAAKFDSSLEKTLKATNKIIAYRRSALKGNVVKEGALGYDEVLSELQHDS